MPFQFLQKQGSEAGDFGQALGTGLGTIGSGLNALAQHKMQQMTRNKDLDFLTKATGGNTEAAQWIQRQSPELQKVIFQNLGSLGALGNMQERSTANPELVGGMQALMPKGESKPSFDELQQGQRLINKNNPANIIQELLKSPQQKDQERRTQIMEEKLGAQKKNQEFKEKVHREKQLLPYISAVEDKHEKDLEDKIVLDEMKRLTQEGNLDHPLFVSTLEKLGIDFNALLKPDSQAFKKLQNHFLQGINKIFGGRVSNQEMATYLQSIPSLSNTKEGREQIIKMFDVMRDARDAKRTAMYEILDKNPNIDITKFRREVSARTNEIRSKKEEEFHNYSDALTLANDIKKDYKKRDYYLNNPEKMLNQIIAMPEAFIDILPNGTEVDLDDGTKIIFENNNIRRV